MLKGIAILGSALAVAAGVTAPSAIAAPAPTPCGGYSTLGYLHYNHCDPNTRVMIWVDRINIGPYKDYAKCVGFGDHRIGPKPEFIDAWYHGKTC
ncbi:hypothetical protein GCM10022247_01700 [Allokutzneria multivorans]|uniref:Secreted protein n=1 Tax=Allokutzneria multivorans TaxID=1142134 RepID=A0ABP7QRL1_9PSEU